MKKLLYPLAFTLTAFLIIYSCSAEEDNTPPPSIIQTPEPETPAPTQYTLTVSAGEGGSVSTEGGTYDDGTVVTITASPDEGYVFVGWQGNNGDNNPLNINLQENTTIETSFLKIEDFFRSKYCDDNNLISESEPNSTTNNYNKSFRPFYDYNSFIGRKQYEFVIIGENGDVNLNLPPGSVNHLHSQLWQKFLNINNNEIPDFVLVGTEHRGEEFGEVYVVIDNELRHRFNSGQSGTRRLVVGDIDKNGSDDLVIIGTGIDGPPYSGAKTQVVYFTPDDYSINSLDNEAAYFHTGAIGDVNNDGNLDVLIINNQGPGDTYVHLGNGDKTFEKKSIGDWRFFSNRYNSKLYDVNSDGNLDLVAGGHEWIQGQFAVDWGQAYRTEVYLGDGEGNFDIKNPIMIPEIDYWGLVNDFIFKDLDQDGLPEIIINRAKGHENYNIVENDRGYDGIKIQIVKLVNGEYVNHQVLDQPDGWFDLPPTWIEWIPFIEFFDVNGDCILDIVPDYEGISNPRFDQLNRYFGLYYKGNESGYFELEFFNPSNPYN